jgi:N-acetylglucosamine kinase-like BadF-type ATPase
MTFFVGVDSGGTKTEAWLGDETRVLAEARAGTAKLTRVGREVAAERLRELLREVSRTAGVDLRRVSRTCVGMAGYSIAEARELTAATVAGMVGGEVEVCGDDEIALDAAFQGGAGILGIGGTGSVVLGRCSDGKRVSAGGWGPVAGDEGSGYWIGREAVRKAFRSYDEGVETGLLEAIRLAWDADDLGMVIGMANARPGPDFAALVPAVVACADAGDEIAARLLTKAGNELAKQVAMVWRKMRLQGETTVCARYTGSVVERIARVNARMKERVAQECAGLTVMDGAVNSLEGALWRARTRAL